MKKIGNFIIITNFIIVMCISIIFIDGFSDVLSFESHYSETANYKLTFNLTMEELSNTSEKVDELTSLAEKYDFNLYALDVLSDNEVNIYVLTTDENYINSLPVSNKDILSNPQSSFNIGHYSDLNRFSLFSKNRIKITQFKHLDNLTFSSVILNFNEGHTEEEINSLTFDLLNEGIHISHVDLHKSSLSREYFKNFKYTFILTSLVILACLVSIIRSSRLIGVHKSEGHGKPAIFKYLLFDWKTPFIIITLFAINVFFYAFLSKFGAISNIWFLITIPLITLMSLFCLLVVFYFVFRIYNQPTSQLINNKMSWKFMINYITLGKVLIMIPIILSSLSIYGLTTESSIYKQRFEKLQSLNNKLYYVKYYNGSYQPELLDSYDSILLDKLQSNLKFSSSIVSTGDSEAPIITYISSEFLTQNNISMNYETAYISENTTLDRTDIIKVASDYSPIIQEVKYIDESILDLVFLNQSSQISNGPDVLFLLMQPNFMSTTFSFEGELVDAQNYVDAMTESLGIGTPYYIGSYEEEIGFFQVSNAGGIRSEVIYFTSLLMLLILFTITIISVQREVHFKEDKVRQSEGYLVSKSFEQYLYFDITSRLLLFFSLTLLFSIKAVDAFVVLIIHFIFELIVIRLYRKRG